MWHYPHSLCTCRATVYHAVDIPCQLGHSSKAAAAACGSPMGQRDIWMDARQFHRPCSTYCVGSANYTFIVQYYFMQSFIFHHMQSGPTLSVPLQTLPVSTELSTCRQSNKAQRHFSEYTVHNFDYVCCQWYLPKRGASPILLNNCQVGWFRTAQ